MQTPKLIKDRAVAENAFRCSHIPHLIDFIETSWQTYASYAEQDFQNRFNDVISDLSLNISCKHLWKPISDKLVELWWEMNVANKLLESGLQLVEHKSKPLIKNLPNIDHLLLTQNGGRVWIECTQARRGPISSELPGFDVEGVGYKPTKEMILRVTNRLDAKAGSIPTSQIQKFTKAYPNFKNDYYIVALGTGNLPNDDEKSHSPSIAYDAVYGLGDPTWVVNRDGTNCSFKGLQSQNTVRKNTGTVINTEGFLDGTYSLISGLLVSNSTLFYPNKTMSLIENKSTEKHLPSDLKNRFNTWSFDTEQMTIVRP